MSGSYHDNQIRIEHTVYIIRECVADLMHGWQTSPEEHAIIAQNKHDIRFVRLALDALEASINNADTSREVERS